MSANSDLILAVAALLALSAGLYRTGKHLAERTGVLVANLLASITLIATLLFAVFVHGRLEIARVLPVSGAIVLANWIPLGASLLMGIVMAQRSVPGWRRISVAALLGIFAWQTLVRDLAVRETFSGSIMFTHGFVLQSTGASCSACSAAELLREHGIQATEPEMVALCLTRPDGTPELGLYRGLKIKTQGTPWRVRIVHVGQEDVRRSDFPPTLALVHPVQVPERPASTARQFSRPSHAVILYGISDDGALAVRDPVTSCLTRWDPKDYDWPVKGLQLVPRQPRHASFIARRITRAVVFVCAVLGHGNDRERQDGV